LTKNKKAYKNGVPRKIFFGTPFLTSDKQFQLQTGIKLLLIVKNVYLAKIRIK